MDHTIRQKFERYRTAESRVFRLVDNAHATDAEPFENAIVGNSFTNHGKRRDYSSEG